MNQEQIEAAQKAINDLYQVLLATDQLTADAKTIFHNHMNHYTHLKEKLT